MKVSVNFFPSPCLQDIVACATSILKNLDGGNKTTQRTYNIAFDIAKQLTQSIQPFTKLMNELNDEYTRIHVFHAVFEKVSKGLHGPSMLADMLILVSAL